MKLDHVTIRFDWGGDGWLIVSVDEIPQCHAQALTIQEGRARIREALSLFTDKVGPGYESHEVFGPRTTGEYEDGRLRGRMEGLREAYRTFAADPKGFEEAARDAIARQEG